MHQQLRKALNRPKKRHVHTVPPAFVAEPITTETQASRLRRERDVNYEKAQTVKSSGKSEEAHSTGQKRKTEDPSLKKRKKSEGYEAHDSSSLYSGHAALVATLGVALGYGAFRKYSAGELNGKTVGVWTGIVGTFAFADFFIYRLVSQKNSGQN
ncbi:putative Bgh-specific protein [Blumeria hordei DH14]|uniref:Putative Bgh-specific protein n=1 Tax=Blumeria graminis f. sp. hordei (strain DH14) TaxID=546991 RepID=N1J9U3_BLUG1|nr:putative Bgh-specific protein [Blumeria hordei DH14]